MILNIIKHPNDILRKKSVEVKPDEIFNSEFKQLVKDMKKTMLKEDGIGLAAPQIGKNIRLIVINTDKGPRVYINPKITKKSWRKNVMEEGCLSLPGIYKKVKRPIKITLEYLDTQGEGHKIKTSGLSARVFQHEVDHLDGVLFIDRVKK